MIVPTRNVELFRWCLERGLRVLQQMRLMTVGLYNESAFNFGYMEKETATDWRLTCGGTRAYTVRHATPLNRDMDEQAADSHFMIRRVTAALLMSGFGLFQAESVGRVLFTDVWGEEVHWTPQFDHTHPELGRMAEKDTDTLYGWIQAALHTYLRRAAEDAHTAHVNPHEALVFVYRSLEWLVEGMGFTWDGIAKELGGTKMIFVSLRKPPIVETDVRHASKSGMKLRASPENYGTWVAGLFDMINTVRAKVEPGHVNVAGKEGANLLSRAIPHVPFE